MARTWTLHTAAARDAAALINRHDGRAPERARREVTARIDEGDVDGALRMDQVRREAEALLSARVDVPPFAKDPA